MPERSTCDFEFLSAGWSGFGGSQSVVTPTITESYTYTESDAGQTESDAPVKQSDDRDLLCASCPSCSEEFVLRKARQIAEDGQLRVLDVTSYAAAYQCPHCEQPFEIPIFAIHKMKLAGDIRMRLVRHKIRHEVARDYYGFWYTALTLPTIVLSALTTICSAVAKDADEDEAKHQNGNKCEARDQNGNKGEARDQKSAEGAEGGLGFAIKVEFVAAVVGTANTLLLAVMAHFGFQGKYETHAQAAKMYDSLLTLLEYKIDYVLAFAIRTGGILHEGKGGYKSIDTEFSEFLTECQKRIKQIDEHMPVVVTHLKDKADSKFGLVAHSFEEKMWLIGKEAFWWVVWIGFLTGTAFYGYLVYKGRIHMHWWHLLLFIAAFALVRFIMNTFFEDPGIQHHMPARCENTVRGRARNTRDRGCHRSCSLF
mmetsp:Transcript_126101/g.315138  ORF Transcript_126101/g.315138 Transcript_126101/m.315138 type:complete len:425 (-) Transcript_126101:132-1406(-)